jgi:hypothetical protein
MNGGYGGQTKTDGNNSLTIGINLFLIDYLKIIHQTEFSHRYT